MRVTALYNTLLLIMSPADTSDLLPQHLIKPVQSFKNQVAMANTGDCPNLRLSCLIFE